MGSIPELGVLAFLAGKRKTEGLMKVDSHILETRQPRFKSNCSVQEGCPLTMPSALPQLAPPVPSLADGEILTENKQHLGRRRLISCNLVWIPPSSDLKTSKGSQLSKNNQKVTSIEGWHNCPPIFPPPWIETLKYYLNIKVTLRFFFIHVPLS